MNKCPHCDEIIAVPASLPAVVSGVPVLLLSCPYCFKLVGIVNDPRQKPSGTWQRGLALTTSQSPT